MSVPQVAEEFNGHGSGAEHRTTIGRAWCFECRDWCYSDSPCGEARCCTAVGDSEVARLRAEVARLTVERDEARNWIASYRDSDDFDPGAMIMLYDQAVNRADAAEAKLEATKDALRVSLQSNVTLTARLDEAYAVIDRIHAAEKAFLSRAVDAEHELARQQPVIEAAKAWWRNYDPVSESYLVAYRDELLAALDAFDMEAS